MPYDGTIPQIDPRYIPPSEPGWNWLGNSGYPNVDDALDDYGRSYPYLTLQAVPFSPDPDVFWAIYGQ